MAEPAGRDLLWRRTDAVGLIAMAEASEGAGIPLVFACRGRRFSIPTRETRDRVRLRRLRNRPARAGLSGRSSPFAHRPLFPRGSAWRRSGSFAQHFWLWWEA